MAMRTDLPRTLRAAARLILLTALGSISLAAQAGSNGYLALRQAVRDANSDRLVAIVASHPGEDYVMPASFLRFHYGFRVVVILVTRGEGGQNSRGPELGDALGRQRTIEAEACADRLGFGIRYLNRLDAGYCRTAREALELWGKDSTTRDLATILRRIKPDVVMTTNGPDETHGHDLGLLAVLPDAVELAGDAKFLTSGLEPVKIPRLFRGSGTSKSELELDMDRWDEVRGGTYRQFAYRVMTEEHLSQAPFRPMSALFDPLVCLAGVPQHGIKPANNLTQGLPTLWNSLSNDLVQYNLEGLNELIERRQSLAKVALWLRHQLLTSDMHGNDPLADMRLRRRVEALDRVIWHSSNLRVDIELPHGDAVVPGDKFHFTAVIHNGAAPFLRSLQVTGPGNLRVARQLEPNHPTVRLQVEYSVPPIAFGQGQILSAPFRGTTYQRPISVALNLGFPGGKTRVSLPLDSISDSYGAEEVAYPPQEISYPLRVEARLRPPIELQVSPAALLIPDGRRSVRFAVSVRQNLHSWLDTNLRVITSPGFVATPPQRRVQLGREGKNEGNYVFDLRVPKGLQPGVHQITLRVGGARLRVPVHRVAVKVAPGIRVGLIEGFDDSSATVLKGLGIHLDRLDDEDVKTRELSGLDTILIDIRALRHRPSARGSFDRLLDFAHDGGRLVMLYHKDTEFAGIDSTELRMIIGKGRVTSEDAPVEVLLPRHPLLNSPNVIRPSDWDGWMQERGLYFPKNYADRFEELLTMADPGEPQEKASLLYARYGKGEFIYCALSLFRQLKSLHPGACRLFANLISP